MGDKRTERMLEEILKLPGNNNCADCHASAPRWASINLGITLCVSCASIHRKLGTHKSRVKSITLDSWDRPAVAHLRSVGNTASNAIYNPDERRNPPPTSSSTAERDSEMEKYIRKKYEQGAFKPGASASRGSAGGLEPTSMNRAREAQARDKGIWDRAQDRGNTRNPELNGLVVKMEKKTSGDRDRDLPPLPVSPAAPVAPRERRRPSPSPAPAPALVDLGSSSNGGGNSTLPLQSLPPQPQQFLSPHPQMFSVSPGSTSTSYLSTSPNIQISPLGYFPAPQQQHPQAMMGYSPGHQSLPQLPQQQSYNHNPFLASSPGAQQQQMMPGGGVGNGTNPFFQSTSPGGGGGAGWMMPQQQQQQQPWPQQQQQQMGWQQAHVQPQPQMLSPYAQQGMMMGGNGGYFQQHAGQ